MSRRVGKAVVRNLVRRRIREAVRLGADPSFSYDLLFIARPPSASATWPALREAVDTLIRRANLRAGEAERGREGDAVRGRRRDAAKGTTGERGAADL